MPPVFRPLATIYLVLATLLFAAVTWRALAYERIGFTEDMALSMAVADAALHGEPILLGPPSHTGGRHLGPIGYWWVMGAKELGGTNYGAIVVIGGLEALALLGVAWLAASLAPEGLSAFAAGSALLCASARYATLLSYPWHNNFLLVFGTLLILAAWHAWRGGRAGYALTILCGSILIQFHYSSLPFVAILLLALTWYRRKEGLQALGLKDFVSVVFWAITFLSWLPLLFYQLRYPGALARTFGPHTTLATAHSGFVAAKHEVEFFLKLFTLGSAVFPSSWSGATREHLTTLLLLACAALLAYGIFRAKPAPRYFLLTLVIASAAYVPAFAWLPPPLFQSYLFTLLPLPVLFMGIAASSALLFVAEGGILLLRVLSGAVFALWLLVSVRDAEGAITKAAFRPMWNSLKHGEEIAAIINNDSGGQRIELLPPQTQSKIMRGVFLYLLGPQYYPQIEYWNELAEIPKSPAPQSSAEYAYFMACPRLQKRDFTPIETQIASQGWEWYHEVSTASCTTCSQCMLFRYRRAEKK